MSKRIYGICVAFLVLYSGCTVGLRQKKVADAVPADTSLSVPETRRGSATVQYTFLDTINRGNELRLTDGDFGKQPSAGVSAVAASAETRYRVQLLASSRIETVREKKKEVEKKISEPVMIGYEAPYYKLYAGDFLKRQDAQSFLPTLKRLGFQDAWIVSTKAVSEN